MTTMDIKKNGIRLMLLGACGASIWSLARLLLHEPRKRTLNKIDLDVRVALLRAVLAPITKLLKRSPPVTALGFGDSSPQIALPALETKVLGLRMTSRFSRLMRGLIEVCQLQQPAHVQHLPFLYLHTATNPLVLGILTHPDLPFVALGSVHTRAVICQHRYIMQSEVLDVTVSLGSASRPHRRGSEVDIVTTVRTAGTAEVLWESINTYLFFHKPARGSHKLAPVNGRSIGLDVAALARQTPRSDSVLTEKVRKSVTLESTLGRLYAGLCYDYNPIHIYTWAARLLGFKQTIAHGMCVAGRALFDLEQTAAKLLPQHISLAGRVRLEVTFKKPMFLPGRGDVCIYHDSCLPAQMRERASALAPDGRPDCESGGKCDLELVFRIVPPSDAGEVQAGDAVTPFQEGRYVVTVQGNEDARTQGPDDVSKV